MSAKHHRGRAKRPQRLSQNNRGHWRSLVKRLWRVWTIIPTAVIVGIIGLCVTYKTTGAEDLRSKVYQPLHNDILLVEASVRSANIGTPPITKALAEMQQSGAILRVPPFLRNRLFETLGQATEVTNAVFPITERIIREMSERIMKIRAEEDDRRWLSAIQVRFREKHKEKKGISDITTFGTLRHAGRTPAIDTQDPNNPVIALPGGPTFVMDDWLTYPESVKKIEGLWTDDEYLYFHSTNDLWYYRITRDDLKRSGATLIDLVKDRKSVV